MFIFSQSDNHDRLVHAEPRHSSANASRAVRCTWSPGTLKRMFEAVFTLNGQLMSTLVSSLGSQVAFSGDGIHRNRAASANVANAGPVPPGTYHLVDRESGGLLGPIKDVVLGRSQWFALYCEDGSVDDRTFVDGVRRGEFRLHPLGPRRMSTGCIVLQYPAEFEALRKKLLQIKKQPIPETSFLSYGTIAVLAHQAVPDRLEPHLTRGSPQVVG
jgi:Protein of unknown function (DUF2778)